MVSADILSSMDPIAHTLVGAALAKSGLEKRSGYAALALIVGANLPDVDGITYFVSADLGLYFRRGWTHGLPAVALWPFVLAGALTLLDRLLGRKRARFGALLPLSLLAVATHPALDWLNNYGMRWLMPFDDRWFYGDTLFIVDPWIWLALGGALFLATSRSAWRLAAWVPSMAALSFLVLTSVPGLLPGKLLFLAGLTGIGISRFKGSPRTETGSERLHRGALALVAVYILGTLALTSAARLFTLAELRRDGLDVEKLMVGPTPMTPFTRDFVAATPSSYRHGSISIWPSMRLTLSPDEIQRTEDSPLMVRALKEREVRGFAIWARFPWAEVEEGPEGFRVTLRDARYSRYPGSEGFGTAVVVLPR
ncbi:MAG TPA: metal-dependent hydrolase [Vicinamibacteria bacterium]